MANATPGTKIDHSTKELSRYGGHLIELATGGIRETA